MTTGNDNQATSGEAVEATERVPEISETSETSEAGNNQPEGTSPSASTTDSTTTTEPTTPVSGKLMTRKPEDKIKWLNILDHGDSGSGKTLFCGTMVKAGLKVLYLAFSEDELLTLDTAGIHGYDYIIIKNYEKQLWPIYLACKRNSNHYDGVIVDGLGDFQQMAKDYELSDEGKVTGFAEKAMKGRMRMAINNWGNLLEMTRHWIDPMLQLPMHKIITCISEPDDDPKTGKPRIYPGLQGSMQQIIAAHFSVVAYSYIAEWPPEVYWCMTTQPHTSIQTKDRTGMCRVFVNPQFKTFLDAKDGKRAKPTELEERLKHALIVKPQTSHVEIKSSAISPNSK